MKELVELLAAQAAEAALEHLSAFSFGMVEAVRLAAVHQHGMGEDEHFIACWQVAAPGGEALEVKMFILPEFLDGDEDELTYLCEQMATYICDEAAVRLAGEDAEAE